MSAVVGLDIGNDNCVIAVAKQGGIEVILNDESNRETPAIVSFAGKQRLIGSAGAASFTMNPRSTISQIKRLIGRNFKEPGIQEELRFLPFSVMEGPDGGILIQARYMDEEHVFTPIQVLSMLLSHLLKMAKQVLGMPVTDCVIGIPSYFTNSQRSAYLDAASIAGLKTLRLLHDCTATALGYGIYKTDIAQGGNIVVFVDIGHCDTQVSVAKFDNGGLTILAHAFDRDLGGRDFDGVLFHHFAGKFLVEYNLDVCSNARARLRLMTACEKLKKVLSANAEAQLNIECLMDEKDVKGLIKREEFENLSSSLLERILVPCRKALDDAHISIHNIHAVELVGSGSRIPAISRVLMQYFGRDLSRTLNASECISRGCALQCAMLSPMFRVRNYEVRDSFPFSIGLSKDEGSGPTLLGSMFRRGEPIPSSKYIIFHKAKPLRMDVIYLDNSELPPGASSRISSFTVDFRASDNENPKLKVKFCLNLHGIVTNDSASLVEDDTNDSATNAPHMNSDDIQHDSIPSESWNENGNVIDGRGSTVKADAPTEKQSPWTELQGKGGVTNRKKVNVSETIFGCLTKEELSKLQALEEKMAHQDMIVEQAKEKKNALEAYIYETRNNFYERYKGFATDAEKEEISQKLQEMEEWLYEEGDDVSEDIYCAKMDELKECVKPVVMRYEDEEARAQAIKDVR